MDTRTKTDFSSYALFLKDIFRDLTYVFIYLVYLARDKLIKPQNQKVIPNALSADTIVEALFIDVFADKIQKFSTENQTLILNGLKNDFDGNQGGECKVKYPPNAEINTTYEIELLFPHLIGRKLNPVSWGLLPVDLEKNEFDFMITVDHIDRVLNSNQLLKNLCPSSHIGDAKRKSDHRVLRYIYSASTSSQGNSEFEVLPSMKKGPSRTDKIFPVNIYKKPKKIDMIAVLALIVAIIGLFVILFLPNGLIS